MTPGLPSGVDGALGTFAVDGSNRSPKPDPVLVVAQTDHGAVPVQAAVVLTDGDQHPSSIHDSDATAMA